MMGGLLVFWAWKMGLPNGLCPWILNSWIFVLNWKSETNKNSRWQLEFSDWKPKSQKYAMFSSSAVLILQWQIYIYIYNALGWSPKIDYHPTQRKLGNLKSFHHYKIALGTLILSLSYDLQLASSHNYVIIN